MKHIIEKDWITGSNEKIDFYDILRLVKKHVLRGSKIFIGTDSFISRNTVCFASAVCLFGGDLGGRYFFFRDKVEKRKMLNLATRITEEVTRSVELGCFLIEEYNFSPDVIELHLDVSPFSAGNATSKFSEMLKGIVAGHGFDCRLKPEAWASQSIADKHSK